MCRQNKLSEHLRVYFDASDREDRENVGHSTRLRPTASQNNLLAIFPRAISSYVDLDEKWREKIQRRF